MLERVKERLESFGYVLKDDIAGLDLDFAVKQIQEGDTNTVFATGEASLTPEQRLNNFLNYLLTHGRDEFSCYRRLRW